ncbi:Uncharacterised protein [Legionella lansingensis]|uniref:Uncharacterized protein n=1 Tax=Legionella lansingensis TaxID=45067 RepID=A0A0W0VJ38_9GAMM|nr:hypothetical protein [Legionella lansingensis]KTD20107.1 hypothetical protein Llan_2036 [Legionella lansingensis]SNV51141.1 Uncharacterised protein [Legionella lansingensis]
MSAIKKIAAGNKSSLWQTLGELKKRRDKNMDVMLNHFSIVIGCIDRLDLDLTTSEFLSKALLTALKETDFFQTTTEQSTYPQQVNQHLFQRAISSLAHCLADERAVEQFTVKPQQGNAGSHLHL